VRILVVVAKIQVRLLKAEEGKVSKATVFDLGLVVSEGKSQQVILNFFFLFFEKVIFQIIKIRFPKEKLVNIPVPKFVFI